MIRIIAFLASLALALSGIAQDSLVRYSEIHFNANFEKEAFHQYFKLNNNDAILDLLLSTKADGEKKKSMALNRMDETVKKIEQSGIDKKKAEKKVKTIYDQVHSTFLIKYEMENHFSEIFSTGNYNCVSATALYALMFDKLHIPYAIQEKPTHVFLVAYPNQNNILVETTSPVFGYLSFDARYKENFINNLKNGKLIGASEASSNSVDELFNKYYFQDANIDLKQLVGIHYMNDAIFMSDRNDLMNAYRQAEKAYLFYPSQRAAFILTSLAARILSLEKLEPIERATIIAKISRYTSMGITNDMVKGEFLKISNEVLAKENDRKLFQECADIVLQYGLQDDELKKEIQLVTYYELGRSSYNQGTYHQAKYYFAKALDQQPNNTELGATFLGALAMSMRNKRDEATVLDTILVYKNRFPPLEKNNNFISILANAYLLEIGNRLETNNINEAEKLEVEFTKMAKQNPDLNIDSYAVGSAYSKLCSYYFKKGMKEKARALIRKGLEFAPDNYELRTRQQMIN